MFPPEWINERNYGISPNMENMNISDRGIFNMYGEAPAIIEAQFSNGCSIKAYIGEGLEIFAIIYDQDGIPVQNTKQAKSKGVAYTMLARWYERGEKSGFVAFAKVMRTIYMHYEKIDKRSTNAASESFNSKIKAFRAQFRGVKDKDFFLFRLAKLYA